MPINSVDTSTVNKAKEIKYQLPTLDVMIVGKWVWVTGETFPARAQLVAMGLRWAREKQKWYWRPEEHARRFVNHHPRPYESIVARYGEMRVQRTETVTA